MRSLSTAFIAILAASSAVSIGHAGTKVYGSGLAATCSRLAIAGLYDRQTLNTCDLALEQEALGRENAAKTHVNRGVVQLRRARLTEAFADFRLPKTCNEAAWCDEFIP